MKARISEYCGNTEHGMEETCVPNELEELFV